MNVKISGVAKGQWKQLVKKPVENDKELYYKIHRSLKLGKKVHYFMNNNAMKSYIVRYCDLNFLVSNNILMTIWRDTTRPIILVSNKVKANYDKEHGYSRINKKIFQQ